MKYRAVIKYATSGGRTLKLRSEWVPHKDIAQEVIDDFDTTNEWREVYETTVERKEDIKQL